MSEGNDEKVKQGYWLFSCRRREARIVRDFRAQRHTAVLYPT